ncbi:MAG: hypothetical protein IPQ04_04535 [Saprospiraceae bacterium]|nr:hypothetical protein [Saprospiraceae bacterium]
MFNNLGSGTYNVTVQDAQLCVVTGQVVVGVLNGPDMNITNLTQTSCGRNNGSFQVSTISGNGPFRYDIGTGSLTDSSFVNLASGGYTVTITDANGCAITRGVQINGSNNLTQTVGVDSAGCTVPSE